jgi:hypothetical protein
MIHSSEGTGPFNGHHIRRLLHNAHKRRVPASIAAHATDLIVTQGKASGAEPDLVFDIQNALRQPLGILPGSLQDVHGQAFGGFLSDARELGNISYQILYRSRIVTHMKMPKISKVPKMPKLREKIEY